MKHLSLRHLLGIGLIVASLVNFSQVFSHDVSDVVLTDEAVGQVVNREGSRTSSSCSFTVKYSADGEDVMASFPCSDVFGGVAEGDAITVYYAAETPGAVSVLSRGERTGRPVQDIYWGVGFLVAAGVCFLPKPPKFKPTPPEI